METLKPGVVLLGPTASHFKGGIVHYTANLYAEFGRLGYPVKLVSFSRGYPKAFFPGASNQPSPRTHIGSALELLDWLNPLSWWNTAFQIKKQKPKIVIFQWWTWFWTLPFLVVIAYLKIFTKCKLVVIAHNPFDHEQALYKRWSSHLVLSFADKIMVPSFTLKKNLVQLFAKKEVVQAFHPLYSFFKRKELSKKRAQQKLKTSSPLLLFFGHIRKYKGLAVLLKALNNLWESGHKINLMIVGEFWEDKDKYLKLIKPKYQKLVKVVDSYVPDSEVALYFSACDAVAIPYLQGSGSGPAKIALAFNKPIVATNVADNPDLFALAKVGEMVEPGNSQQLGVAINKVLSNPGKYQLGISKVKPRLSWAALVAKIVA